MRPGWRTTSSRTICSASSERWSLTRSGSPTCAYIWTAEGWLYAAAVMDLNSRRIVGWSMSDTMQARMVSDALLMALWRRGKPAALMHHSEQGSQYTSDEFQQLLKSQKHHLQHEPAR